MGVKYSGNGTYIFTCSVNGAVRKWDGCEFGRVGARDTLTMGNPVRQFAVAPDERLLFQPEGNVVKCVDVEDGRVVRRLEGHVDYVNACVFRNDALELCSSGHDLHTILWQNRGSLNESVGGDNDNDGDETDCWSD